MSENLEPVLEMIVQGQAEIASAIKSLTPTEKTVADDGQEVVVKGKKGDKGDQGEKGEQGIEGKAGPKGETGERGLMGETGEKGDTGPQGEIGPKGDIGDRGEKGDKGERGDQGRQGERGAQGSADNGAGIVSKINSQPNEKDNPPARISLEMIEGSEKLKRKNELGYLRELADVEIIGEPTDQLVLTWNRTKHKWVARAATAVGSVPLAFDISSQFNGVLTTFTIPAYSAILMFIVTGWPPNGALRPTTDFTTPSGTTVSLTSEVSAPQAGVTGIILYVPA